MLNSFVSIANLSNRGSRMCSKELQELEVEDTTVVSEFWPLSRMGVTL